MRFDFGVIEDECDADVEGDLSNVADDHICPWLRADDDGVWDFMASRLSGYRVSVIVFCINDSIRSRLWEISKLQQQFNYIQFVHLLI